MVYDEWDFLKRTIFEYTEVPQITLSIIFI